MLSNISRAQLIGAWLATVVVAFACSVVGGAVITVSAGELWLVASLVPPAVMLLVGRDAQPLTVPSLCAINRAETKAA